MRDGGRGWGMVGLTGDGFLYVGVTGVEVVIGGAGVA